MSLIKEINFLQTRQTNVQISIEKEFSQFISQIESEKIKDFVTACLLPDLSPKDGQPINLITREMSLSSCFLQTMTILFDYLASSLIFYLHAFFF